MGDRAWWTLEPELFFMRLWVRDLNLGPVWFFEGREIVWIPAAADLLGLESVAWFLFRAPEEWEVPGALCTP